MRIGYELTVPAQPRDTADELPLRLLEALAARDRDGEILIYPCLSEPQAVDAEAFESAVARLAGRANARRHDVAVRPLAPYLFQTRLEADFEQALGEPDTIVFTSLFCPMLLRRSAAVMVVPRLDFLDSAAGLSPSARIAAIAGLFNAAVFAERFVAPSAELAHRLGGLYPHLKDDAVIIVPFLHNGGEEAARALSGALEQALAMRRRLRPAEEGVATP